MTIPHEDHAAVDAMARKLAEQEQSLPDDVTARLALARQTALNAMPAIPSRSAPRWFDLSRLVPATGLIAAAIAALILWPHTQVSPPMPELDEPEMAAAAEMDMLDEIELIAWLLEEDADVG